MGWEDPLEEGMTTHSSILPEESPWTEEPGGLQSTGSQRVRHDCPLHLVLLGFFLVLAHGTYSSVTSFCLSCYLFYLCLWLVMFLDLGEVVPCRKCLMHPSSALPSGHPS